MKKLALILVVVFLLSLFAGCGQTAKTTETPKDEQTKTETAKNETTNKTEEPKKELKKIRVAVMPFFLSTPVNYIKKQGWDKEAGLDMEIIMFANGAAMNEALGANLWDVAPTGGAAIYGVANFNAKFIADFIDGTGGNEIYVRKDSKIAKVKGFNPTFPEILGDPESVKGATILQTSGTTSQMSVVKYLQAIGVKDTDVNIVHMEFPQVYQAFVAGQGDIASMVSPYVFKAPEHGWVKAASLQALGTQLFETVITTPEAYENMKEELATFLHLLYKANEALESDPTLKFNEVKEWYVQNGTEVKDEEVRQECELKSFLTKSDVQKIEYGKYQREYAEFLVSIQKLKVEQVDVVVQNTKRDILDMALAMK